MCLPLGVWTWRKRSRAFSVSDAVSDSASAQAAPKASPCEGRATQGRAQSLPNHQSPGRVGSQLVWGPAQIQPARSRARKAVRGFAGQGPSDAGESAASLCRAEPGSGREPTRVGSGPAPAIFRALKCVEGVARQGPSDSGEDVAPPRRAEPGSGWEPTRVGPGGSPLSRSKARPGCEGVAKQERSNVGEGAAAPTGRSPGGVGKPLAWGPQRRPPPALQGAARLRRSNQAEAERLWEGRGPSLPGEDRVGPGAHSGGVRPRFGLCDGRRAMGYGRRQAEAEQSKGWQLRAQR